MNDVSIFTTGDGVRLAYRFDGAEDLPVLMLSNSIATTLHMWDPQIDALTRHFRVLRYDLRGHGRSDAPKQAYSLDRLGRDVIELLDALDIERVQFMGLSLGGLVGQWLGIREPGRIDRLILATTTSYFGEAAQWDARIAAVLRDTSMAETTAMFLGNWFPKRMLDSPNATVDTIRAMLLSIVPHGIAGNFAAVRDTDLRRTVTLIEAPTLVIAGRFDTVTLLEHSEAIAAAVPGAKLVVLPAVHLPNLELPDEFIDAVLGFLVPR